MDDIEPITTTLPPSYAYWVDFVAGWCAGAAGVLVVQPVDTLLTRYQAGLSPRVLVALTATHGSTASVAAAAARPRALETFRSLYRGAMPMVWTVPLQNMLLMGGYGIGQSYCSILEDSGTTTYSHNYTAILLSGSLGGVAQSFLMSPVELVKIQRQCSTTTIAPGLLPRTSLVLSSLLSPSMWGSLWSRGLGATLLRDGLPHGVWFVAYQYAKDALDHDAATDKSGGLVWGGPVQTPLLAGAFAATVAWAVGYPADVIKTRIQFHAAAAAAAASSSSYTRQGMHQPLGILDTAKEIVHESGSWRGLYRGFGWKLVRAIPASMVGFGVYEAVKRELLHWVA